MNRLLLLTVLLLSLPGLVFSAPARADSPPNVVLIISDDHAWTDYSFMGHPHIRTPNLDRLAGQSLVFRHGYVPSSLCCPSLASIITGLYPHQHKITCNDPPMPAGSKPAEFYRTAAFREGREVMNRHLDAVPTLPRLLSQRGYASFQAGKWWQGDFARGGFTHGMTKGNRHGDEGLKIGRETMQPIYDFIAGARRDQKPFFVWYAPMMPHQPHTPPPRLLDKYRDKNPSLHITRYWAMVEWFDETCGDLLGYLDQQQLATNTLVFYVTDNGWIQSPNTNRVAPKSKLSPYDGGLRTPIMVRWPGKVRARIAPDLATSLDLAPTILSAVGIPVPTRMPGLNLLDTEAVQKRKTLFGECFVHTAIDLNNPAKNLLWRWVIHEGQKLIVPSDPALKPELYDLAADPHETNNLAERQADLEQSLRGKLSAW